MAFNRKMWQLQYNKQNRLRKSANKKEATQQALDEVRRIKEATPCKDCGRIYPHYIMDFDHRDPSTKVAGISRLVQRSWKQVSEEIAKCDVLCSNCHRTRTYKRVRGIL